MLRHGRPSDLTDARSWLLESSPLHQHSLTVSGSKTDLAAREHPVAGSVAKDLRKTKIPAFQSATVSDVNGSRENPQKTGQIAGHGIKVAADSLLGSSANVARGGFCFEGDGGLA